MASTAPHKRREICLDLDVEPVPRGWERCLDLKTGVMYFKKIETGITNGRKKLNSVKVSDRFKSCRGDTDAMKLDLEGDLKLRVTCGQQKYSILTPPVKSLSKPAPQSLKRHRLFFNDEDDGLGLQLSLSLRSDPYTESRAVKSSQKLQPEENIPQHLQLDLYPRPSPQERRSQEDSPARMGQNPVNDTASSSLSRCSSSASSLSEAVEAGKEMVNSIQEAESNKCQNDGLKSARRTINANSVADMIAAGCGKCLMFVLMSRNNPKCPKCGSSILVDLPGPNEKSIRRRSLEQ